MKKLFTILTISFLFSCGESADSARIDSILELSADLATGKTLYDSNCASCHAADGSGTSLGDNIVGANDERDVLDIVITGEGSMPAYGQLSDQELADITAYTISL